MLEKKTRKMENKECVKFQVSTVSWQNSQLKHFWWWGVCMCHALPGRKMLLLKGCQASDSLEMNRMLLMYYELPALTWMHFSVKKDRQFFKGSTDSRNKIRNLDWCRNPGHFQNLSSRKRLRNMITFLSCSAPCSFMYLFIYFIFLSVKQRIVHVNLTFESQRDVCRSGLIYFTISSSINLMGNFLWWAVLHRRGL